MHVVAFENAKPFKMVCGSYHNVCFSYKIPQAIETKNPAAEPVKEIVKV